MGGTIFIAIVLAAVFSTLMIRGILPGPFISVVYMLVVLVMAGELSSEALRARLLSRELHQNQQRMNQATAAAGLGLWEWDMVRDEIWLNEGSRTRLGAGESEWLNFNRLLKSLYPDDREQARQAILSSFDHGGEFETEYRILSPDGDLRWIVAFGSVQYGGDGRPHLVRGASVDITGRRQAEKALKESEARLREAQKIAHMG